ncbi:8268_t:CDS:2 [Funneliformis mosseae]|uniref:8268_t:CDS:1 n=1 Tax=Funneliformis mosseae TaxID=27381 RepID=A0A9N9BBN5_FUNMO|nr:8268_t:CDS:2 [Funneliformis mosseae]
MADIYSNEKLYQVLECNMYVTSILYLLIEVKNEIGIGKCDLITQSDYEVIINDIEKAVLHLYKNNLIFVDLHDSNILVIRNSKGYHRILIDFDWVSRENVKFYLLLINLDIIWLIEVRDNELLKKKYDVYWLN